MSEAQLDPPASTPAAWAGIWWLTWGVIVLGCLGAALVNRGPPAFGDTEAYLVAAKVMRPTHERAFGYGAFLRLTGGLVSLWLPALVQAALAATVAVRLLALEAAGWPAHWPRRWRLFLPAAFAVVLVAGHLPWVAAFVMPDLFTGLLVLTLILLAEHWPRLATMERMLGFSIMAGATTMHLTHAPLLLGLAAVAGAFGYLLPLASRRLGPALKPARRAALLALATAVIGWGALVGANLFTYRQATASLGGPVFLFARLQADTDAVRLLRPPCEAGAAFAICDRLDRLAAERLSVDEFLWGMGRPAMLPELGWMVGFYQEAAVLNAILLRQGWQDWLWASAGRAVAQLGTFELGDGMDRVGLGQLPQGLRQLSLPAEAAVMSRTRQAEDGLLPLMPRGLADGLAAAGLLGVAALLVLGLARRQPAVWWPALLVLAAWFGNAALVALGGEAHGRYGARLVWLMPLLAGALVLRYRRAGPTV